MIPIIEHLVQRYGFIVDLGTDAVISDVRVNRVGKIQRAGAFGELLYIAFRCKHINFIGEKVGL